MLVNLYDPAPKAAPADLARVKGWAREAFGLADDDVVLVTELRCADDDCPDVETVVAVMGAPGKARRHKLPKPVAEVTRDEVFDCAFRGTHG